MWRRNLIIATLQGGRSEKQRVRDSKSPGPPARRGIHGPRTGKGWKGIKRDAQYSAESEEQHFDDDG